MRDYPLWQMKGSAPRDQRWRAEPLPLRYGCGSPAASVLGPVTPKSSPGVCLYIECIPEWPTGEFPKGRGAGSLDLDSEGSPWGQIQVELVMGSGLSLPHP